MTGNGCVVSITGIRATSAPAIVPKHWRGANVSGVSGELMRVVFSRAQALPGHGTEAAPLAPCRPRRSVGRGKYGLALRSSQAGKRLRWNGPKRFTSLGLTTRKNLRCPLGKRAAVAWSDATSFFEDLFELTAQNRGVIINFLRMLPIFAVKGGHLMGWTEEEILTLNVARTQRTSVANPWLALPSTAPYVLPEDRLKVEAFNAKLPSTSPCRLDVKTVIPEPFIGAVTSAPVVVLQLNPGLDPAKD